MARLLIVSRSMALAMRLADQHEVSEHSADDLEALGTDLDADVLVLDIGDPIRSVTTVNSLREAGRVTPVLLVSGYQPEWEQVEAQRVDGVRVVPLPITRAALLTGIAELTGGVAETLETEDSHEPQEPEEPEGPPEPGPPEEPGDVEPPAAEVGEETVRRPPDPTDDPAEPDDGGTPPWGTVATGARDLPDLSGVDGRALAAAAALPPRDDGFHPRHSNVPLPAEPLPAAVARRGSRLGDRPRKLRRNAPDTQGLGLVTDPLGPRTDPYGLANGSARGVTTPPRGTAASSGGVPVTAPGTPGTGSVNRSALDRRLDAEAASLADRRGAGRGGVPLRAADLVQALLDQAGDLYGVGDTAQVLADDVIERAGADAAAILVPDGPIWRVSGGVGLRPLERRLVLEGNHWLITEIGAAGRAVLIDDTDIIREQLAGAPLAAWRHLLAVPVADVRAIVVLARGKEAGPFSDGDLGAVIAPVREAAALLAQALQTRRLARALSALRETDDAPGRPESTR